MGRLTNLRFVEISCVWKIWYVQVIVFDQDADGNDISHAMRRDTLERIPFFECGNTWDIELELVPKADVAIALGEAGALAHYENVRAQTAPARAASGTA